MKKVVVIVACALVLTATVRAGEPASGQMNFTAGGGINVPNAEDANSGFAVGGGLGFHVSPQFVLGVDVSYLGYGREEGTMDMLGTPVDYSMSQNFFTYMGSARYFFSTNRAAPYVKGFAGRFNFNLDSVIGGETLSHSYSDLEIGGGIGLLIRGEGDSNLFIEALFHSLQVEEDSAEVFTVTMGMDVSFRP